MTGDETLLLADIGRLRIVIFRTGSELIPSIRTELPFFFLLAFSVVLGFTSNLDGHVGDESLGSSGLDNAFGSLNSAGDPDSSTTVNPILASPSPNLGHLKMPCSFEEAAQN